MHYICLFCLEAIAVCMSLTEAVAAEREELLQLRLSLERCRAVFIVLGGILLQVPVVKLQALLSFDPL